VDISDRRMTVDADAVHASRQAGVLFLMSGLLAVVGIPTAPSAQLVSTTLVLIPVALSVGLIISGRVQAIEREQQWGTALMATLAHDVRSPLSTIQGVLELVSDDGDLPDHFRPLLAAATRQTSRISTLSSNLLDLERVGRGRLRLDLSDFVLADVGRDVVELVGRGDVTLDVDPTLRLRADRPRVAQMLMNLSTNALRHGEPPVVVAARTEGNVVRISVRDHGAGVPVADQPFLFERFPPTDPHPNSVGLGLWIVKLLAEAHGGGASYRTVEAGAELTIELPATPTT